MKRRVNIRIEDTHTVAEALRLIGLVVSGGRVSKGNTCYCYISTFTDGSIVSAETTKAGNDTFWVGRKSPEAFYGIDMAVKQEPRRVPKTDNSDTPIL